MVDGGRLSFFTRQLSAALKMHNQNVKFWYFDLEECSGGSNKFERQGKEEI